LFSGRQRSYICGNSSTTSSSVIISPLTCIRSRNDETWGEQNRPTLRFLLFLPLSFSSCPGKVYGDFRCWLRSVFAILRQTLPLPLVPATWTTTRFGWDQRRLVCVQKWVVDEMWRWNEVCK
jgi:hypothetical protein